MATISQKSHAQGSAEPPLDKGVIRLYGMRFCPYVHRVRLVLAAKNITYETVNIHLKNKPDWYLVKHPAGSVPLLEWDGHRLSESLVIADYLDEKYPEPKLWSQDPFKKAIGRITIQNFTKVDGYVSKLRENQSDDAAYEGLIKEIGKLDKQLALQNTPFFSGEKPGMVDYMLAPLVRMLKLFLDILKVQREPINKELIPRFVSWVKAMREDPVVQRCQGADGQLKEFYQSYVAGTPNYDVGL